MVYALSVRLLQTILNRRLRVTGKIDFIIFVNGKNLKFNCGEIIHINPHKLCLPKYQYD